MSNKQTIRAQLAHMKVQLRCAERDRDEYHEDNNRLRLEMFNLQRERGFYKHSLERAQFWAGRKFASSRTVK